MQNKKIMITLVSICIALVAIVAALVIVLVSGGSRATSNITVKFVSTDVACEIEASYARIDIPAANTVDYYFSNKIGDKLIINENTTSGQLNPTSDITLDKTYRRVVFQYKFTNTMLTSPMYVELIGMPDNDPTNDPAGVTEELTNINMLYYNTYANNYYSRIFSGVYDEELSTTMGKLVVPAQCTKYVYLVVTVASLTDDASFTGQIEWAITKGDKPEGTYNDASGKLTMTDIYEGCEVTESDLNHSTINIRTLDWYTDSSLSTKANFPITTTSTTTLYSSYLKGNIAEENVSYFSYTFGRGLQVSRESLVVGASSTVYGYSPITATDTTLVIPDMFQLSDGRILPIIYHYGAYFSSDEEFDLLKTNTTVTTLYYGNNIYYIDGIPTTGSVSVLNTVYFGLDFEVIGDGYVDLNTALTYMYFAEGTTTNWGGFESSAGYSGVISEDIVSDPQQSVAEFKNTRPIKGRINCGWARFAKI